MTPVWIKKWLDNRSQLVVGIAVTETHCTLVVVQKTATAMTLRFKGQHEFVQSPYEGGSLIIERIPFEWIKTCLGPFKVKKVSVTCQTKEMVVKCMHAPLQSPEKVTAFLKEKMGQYVVFSGADIVIDWMLINQVIIEGTPQQKVLAGALKRETATEMGDLFSKSGLVLTQITPPYLGILPFVEPDPEGDFQGVLYMEPLQSKVMLLHRQKLLHLYAFPLGFHHWELSKPQVIEELAKLFRLEEVSEVGSWSLHTHSELESDICMAFEQQFSKEMKPIRPQLNLSKGLVWDPDFESVLALGAVSHVVKNLNLVDSSHELDRQKWIVKMTMWILVASGAALLMFFFFFMGSVWIEHRIKQTKRDLAELNKQYQEVVVIEKKLAETKYLILNRRKLIAEQDRFAWQKFFLELPVLMTGSIKLTSLEEKPDGMILIIGQSISSEDVFQFLRQLRGYAYLQSADLLEVSQARQTGWVEFTLQAKKKVAP